MLAALYRRAAPFVLVAVAVVIADASAGFLKVLVGENRPSEPDPLVSIPHSHSFPSGHTATAVAAAVVLSVLAPRAVPLFVLLAAGVAYSRLYVGAHFPLDVVGGAVLGAAIALLLLAVVRRRSDRVLRPGR